MGNSNDKAREWFGNFTGINGNGRVPCQVVFDGQAWHRHFVQHREVLEQLKRECPNVDLFLPGSQGSPARTGEVTVTDAWGCEWLYNEWSSDGQVVGHPLEDWSDPKGFKVPDPDAMDWAAMKASIDGAKVKGEPAGVWFEHGFFFLRLTYIRGFANLMMDIAERSGEFMELLEDVTVYWIRVAERIASLEPDIVYWADDLGMQNALPISPGSWRELIKPSYGRILQACKEKGAKIFLHTDGYINDIIPDLVECGVDVLNPQDLVNGLDNLSAIAKGRVALNLDIDRQRITPFGTPEEIREHIGECVKLLGSPQGGLSLIYGAYLGVPIENLIAVVRGMQEYHDYWIR